jgi:hypothetical protein
MDKDQYGIDVPALPRFMRRLDAVCLCRGGGGKKKQGNKPASKPAPAAVRPAAPAAPAVNVAAQPQQQASASAQAQAQQQAAAIERQRAADAAAAEAERGRIAEENKRVTAEQASYVQAAEAASTSQTSPDQAEGTVSRRRRRGLRTSILAGETGLARTGTLG